ncbi:hypothetical protein T265_05399 [Opisthorchis viverrini]|uniref:SRCR domain-containing protein n=3 Tax=Opisthorchis viverrini TaxID=6198 RepID=A0A074ZP44_OPIVI|nr:hypothetical protein T265_05399 [Opisthorchis viverrini]KER27582.1 hypothetical protein T265_05399 [Opisthorchis viverrini]
MLWWKQNKDTKQLTIDSRHKSRVNSLLPTRTSGHSIYVLNAETTTLLILSDGTKPLKSSKKTTCWSLLIFLTLTEYNYVLRVNAYTVVNTSVSGRQRWRLEDSPFVVRGQDLWIMPDATLELDPGVHVYVDSGLAIKVKGTMIARGIQMRKMDGFQNTGVQIVAGESLVDLEYADDIALIFEDQSEAQALLNKLTAIMPSFGRRLAYSKSKVFLQSVPSANISLTIQGEPLEIVESFTYLGSCISSDGSVFDEVSARISKGRTTFANLRYLWRQKYILPDLKGRVYQATPEGEHRPSESSRGTFTPIQFREQLVWKRPRALICIQWSIETGGGICIQSAGPVSLLHQHDRCGPKNWFGTGEEALASVHRPTCAKGQLPSGSDAYRLSSLKLASPSQTNLRNSYQINKVNLKQSHLGSSSKEAFFTEKMLDWHIPFVDTNEVKLCYQGDDQRIVFSKIPTSLRANNSPNAIADKKPRVPRRIRLVEGEELREGLLELWIANRWRPVCSRNNEWTRVDCRVACQNLGFADGNFTLGPMAQNRTASVEIISPGCLGNESTWVEHNGVFDSQGLFACPGLKHVTKVGSTVCRVNQSSHHVAALSSSPYPPMLKHVRLSSNAYDALNFSYIRGPAILQDISDAPRQKKHTYAESDASPRSPSVRHVRKVVISNTLITFPYCGNQLERNMGHGAVISSLLGYIRLIGLRALNNGGDGTRIRLISGSRYHWPEETPELVQRAQWPCRPGAIPASPVFPFLVVAELPGATFREAGSCELPIESDQTHQVLTITLLEVIHDPSASGSVEIWDTSTREQLAHWILQNRSTTPARHLGVLPGRVYQGISSIKNKVLVRFHWTKPGGQAVCSQLSSCIRVVMHVSVGQTKVPEVLVEDSHFNGNTHRGLDVRDPWSFVRVVNSHFTLNQYDAGLRIVNGSADVLVNNCTFESNERTGMNVSTAGGFRQINQSLFARNVGHGLSVWNPRSSCQEREPNSAIETHVHTTKFTGNRWDGIQFYNSCLSMNILVNFTLFEYNGASGIRTYSCLNGSSTAMTNLTVGYSLFKGNQHAAIWIEPMAQMTGHVTNCTFTQHRNRVIHVDNSLDMIKAELYRSLPVDYQIRNSEFYDNQGTSVIHLRLTEISEVQKIRVIYNRFTGNREIASHLTASDKCINASINYWGSLQDWGLTEWGAVHKAVGRKLFGQNQRYTLARVEYHPLLKDPDLHSEFTTANEPPYVPEFREQDPYTGQIRLGGRIPVERSRRVELTALSSPDAYYHVTKDIFIPPGGILDIQPGVRLKFENGLGLFSQGELRIMGTEAMSIEMNLFETDDEIVLPNFVQSGSTTEDLLARFTNRTIRLVGGYLDGIAYEGRVECRSPPEHVQYAGEDVWGTVCERGFGTHAAMLVCSSLGLVAHPKDWLLPPEIRDRLALNANRWFNASSAPIHLANLDCLGHETDLFECRHDSALEHDCTHAMDVVIRCYLPGWSGIRVTASDPGSRTPIRHLRISNGGLLDFSTMEFMPGLQLDYYAGTINRIEITNSRSHGLMVQYSHPIDSFTLSDSRLVNNLEDALLTRTPWIHMNACQFEGSRFGSGINYDPVMSPQDMFQFHAGAVHVLTLFNSADRKVEYLEDGWQTVTESQKLHPTGITFVNIQPGQKEEKEPQIKFVLLTTYLLLDFSTSTSLYHPPVSARQTIYRSELLADDLHRLHQLIVHLLDYPVTTSPTSEAQASVSPNATIGPTGSYSHLLPASTIPCHTLRCSTSGETTVEELIIYDSSVDEPNPSQVYSWHIPRDLVRLPFISSGHQITIELRVSGTRTGRLSFAIETRDLQDARFPDGQLNSAAAKLHSEAFRLQPGDTRNYPVPEFVLQDCTVRGNRFGLTIHHYNDPVDRLDRLFWRQNSMVFRLSNSSILQNKDVGLNIPSVSRFSNDWYMPSFVTTAHSSERISMIAYQIENSVFMENEGGSILAEHNHVEFANNVWSYNISHCRFEQNGQASSLGIQRDLPRSIDSRGIAFYLPYVSNQYDWRYQPITTHRLRVSQTTIVANHQFQFVVDGHHAQVDLIDNQFEQNTCQSDKSSGLIATNGLIRFEGMEKDIQMRGNRVHNNHGCQFVVRFQGRSQVIGAQSVFARLTGNVFSHNLCHVQKISTTINPANPLTCYTIGVFGTQNVTLHENVLDNFKIPKEFNGTGMQYELIAGVHSTQIPNYLDATRNYWGTTNVTEIQSRIFQFENWNCLSVVRFDGFYESDKFSHTNWLERVEVTASTKRQWIPMDGVLGGLLTQDLRLPYRTQPYRVLTDLTVMPGHELRIDAGVRLEFAPHVGILVLGRLIARGFREQPIQFAAIPVDPMPVSDSNGRTGSHVSKTQRPNVVGRAPEKPHQAGRIGLSTEHLRLIGGDREDEGFVHFYNVTTQRWDIACDHQFSTEVAQVICYELGRPTLNAIMHTSDLYDYQMYGFDNPFVQKHVWMESYTCQGFEKHRRQCSQRFNYDHLRCLRKRAFVFLRCAARPSQSGPNLVSNTWGNIRIVRPFELDPIGLRLEDRQQSVLEYVVLENAGLLHGQIVSALATVFAHPRLSFINITNCIGDGFEFINPRGIIDIANTSVRGCLGRAMALSVFNGDSSDPTTTGGSDHSQVYDSPIPMLPPRQGSLLTPPRPSPGRPMGARPSDLVKLALDEYPLTGDRNLLGLVPMCAGEKVLDILDRLLVYYQYTWTGSQICTKIFRSRIPGRRLAWRFLAVKLYHDPFLKNSVELYNGANFNTTFRIAHVTAKRLANHSIPIAERFTYITSPIHDSLGVYVHASPANNRFGFVAEVVTLPLSPERTYPELAQPVRHKVDTCEFESNQGGGISIVSVGETGPDVLLSNLRFIRNGLVILNITGPSAIHLRMTNAKNLAITNSYFYDHSGHVIRALLLASQLSRGSRLNVTNNAIVRNRFGGAIWIEGNHFNTLQVVRNYIAHNDCGLRDLIRISGVLANPFAQNFVHDNCGDVILNCSGEEDLSHGSLFIQNGFYKNQALNYTKRTTVFAENSKNQFTDNYFKNPVNDFELVVGNRSVIRTLPIQPGTNCPSPDEVCPHGWTLRLEFDACLCYRPDHLDARSNWWGDTVSTNQGLTGKQRDKSSQLVKSSTPEIIAQSFARSRVYDAEDDPYRIRVDLAFAYPSNQSVLGEGTQCPPTWAFHDFNCFYYIGIPMTYEEAHDFCLTEVGATLAIIVKKGLSKIRVEAELV